MVTTDFNPEQQIRALLEEFQRGPFLALIAAQSLRDRFSFRTGLRQLQWKWRRGSFSHANANLAIFERLKHWRWMLASSFVSAPFPAQVLNEFRNALTHLSRATASIDPSVAERELGDARRHLERATRDSYKILAISKHDSLVKLTNVVELKSHALPITLYNKLRFIQDERRDILIQEHCSPSGSRAYNDLRGRYKNLVRTLVNLEDEIKSEYKITKFSVLLWNRPSWQRKLLVVMLLFVFMVFGSFMEEKYSCLVVHRLDIIANKLSLRSIMSERCMSQTVITSSSASF